MFYKKDDPLVDSVRKVMEQNNRERQAAAAVNSKFGITDRRALPHERQPDWDAAYKKVLSEGVEALDEISNKTLKSYIKKAAKSINKDAYKVGVGTELGKYADGPHKYFDDASRRTKTRVKGIAKAVDRLEEDEKVEEGLKMGDYGHPRKEKSVDPKKMDDIGKKIAKTRRLAKILKRRIGKGDGKESVEQSRREDK